MATAGKVWMGAAAACGRRARPTVATRLPSMTPPALLALPQPMPASEIGSKRTAFDLRAQTRSQDRAPTARR